MKTKFSKLLLVSLIAAASACAQAASPQTGAMTVSATVTAGCSLSPNAALNFGIYDPSVASTANTGATLLITCTSGTPFAMWSTTGLLLRTMVGPAITNLLPYTLYGDSLMTTELSVATGAGSILGVGTGLPVSVPIYGKVAAGYVVPTGAYTQSINLTLSY